MYIPSWKKHKLHAENLDRAKETSCSETHLYDNPGAGHERRETHMVGTGTGSTHPAAPLSAHETRTLKKKSFEVVVSALCFAEVLLHRGSPVVAVAPHCSVPFISILCMSWLLLT